MAKNYKFPRVDISQFARVKSTPTAATPDVVPILLPIMAPIGPHGKIVRITSLTEYYETFGVPSYDDMGLSAILIMRWLNQNGTIYTYRMVDESSNESAFELTQAGSGLKITFNAKYKGNKYNDIKFKISSASPTADKYNIRIEIDGIKTSLNGTTKLVEEFSGLTRSSISRVLSMSSTLVKDFEITFTGTATALNSIIVSEGITIPLKTSYVDSNKTYYTRYTELLAISDPTAVSNFVSALMSTNQTPVDMILDMGYPDTLKEAIYKAASYAIEETERGLFVAFSTYVFNLTPSGTVPTKSTGIEGFNNVLTNNAKVKYTKSDFLDTSYIEDAYKIGWCSVFDGYVTLTDNVFGANDELFTPITMPFALNVLFNTQNYSYHRPTAGTTYGRLNNFKNLSGDGPTTAQKDTLFKARINYAEKDGDSIDIMTNRTFAHIDDLNKQTPLDFINNVRVKNKIMRDLGGIMKKYLYEYADGDTLLKCYTECNTYLNGWINNKALTSANVYIEIDPETEEYMYATLTIKFRGTVEYINLRLMID